MFSLAAQPKTEDIRDFVCQFYIKKLLYQWFVIMISFLDFR